MLIFEIIMVAMAAIRANVLRAVLTTLGIIIGVAAVIAVVALGQGAQRRVQQQIQSMGTNVLTIRPNWGHFGGVRNVAQRLYVRDADALKRESNGLLTVSPVASSGQQVTYSRWNAHAEIYGVWPEYFAIHDHHLALGRYFTEGELQGRRRVAVLGANVLSNLAGQDSAALTPESILGQTIQIRGVPFVVIGILKAKGESGFQGPDEDIFVPTSTALYRLFGGRERLNSIEVSTASPQEQDQAYSQIDQIMRRQHRLRPGDDADFQVFNAAEMMSTFNETNKTLTYLLAGIAGISLLVGGIGIMNIMLVSVTERTREIGVRKALGATRQNIMFQFLVESLALCVLGGILGVGVGFLAAHLMTTFAQWQTYVAPYAVFTALGFSAGVGLFFGMWPARRAARLDPIEALRYE
jgi:putative ABC transport system permease protein